MILCSKLKNSLCKIFTKSLHRLSLNLISLNQDCNVVVGSGEQLKILFTNLIYHIIKLFIISSWKMLMTKIQENFHPSYQNFGKVSIQNECVIKIIILRYIRVTSLEQLIVAEFSDDWVRHRDLEQMEPKVIWLSPSEGGKLVILHNFGAP